MANTSHPGSTSVDIRPEYLLLRDALHAIGITAPTFYRWIRTGRVADCRVRGIGGRTFVSTMAVEDLRRMATHVDYIH
jgi:hypothetical protein